MYTTVYSAPIASFATVSSEIDLSKGWHKVWLEVPTMTSNSTLYVQAAYANSATGGIYRRVVQKDAASAAASVDFQTQSSTTSRMIDIPAQGLRYVKVESQNVLSFTANFNLICSDNV
jgi:hypothetical protein